MKKEISIKDWYIMDKMEYVRILLQYYENLYKDYMELYNPDEECLDWHINYLSQFKTYDIYKPGDAYLYRRVNVDTSKIALEVLKERKRKYYGRE